MEAEPELERLRRTDGLREEASLAVPGVPTIDLETAVTMHQLSLRAQGASRHTIRAYERVERDYIGCLRVERPIGLLALPLLDMEHARTWLLRLQARELAASSIHVYSVVLKCWAKFLTIEEFFLRSPLDRLKVQRAHPPVIQTFTPEQLQAVIHAAGRSGPLAWRNVAVQYLLIATGIRAAELVSLRVEDVDIHHGVATVLGKGRKPRRIHFDGTTGKMLIRYLAIRRSGEPWLFLSREGRQWTTSGLAHNITMLGRMADVTGVRLSPHTYRHTYAVNFARAYPGAVFQLQDYLGHSDPGTTRRYVRFAENEAPLPGPGVVALLGLDRLGQRR